jgi:hypothetical protein
MKQFPAGLAERYSQMWIGAIQRHCLNEFDTIIQETSITEKLDQLDGLVAGASGFDVSMASFEFKHADPEFVKHAIVRQVKQREVLLLRRSRPGKCDARGTRSRRNREAQARGAADRRREGTDLIGTSPQFFFCAGHVISQ